MKQTSPKSVHVIQDRARKRKKKRNRKARIRGRLGGIKQAIRDQEAGRAPMYTYHSHPLKPSNQKERRQLNRNEQQRAFKEQIKTYGNKYATYLQEILDHE